MSLSTGTRLGPYEILFAIGAGGMGEVYRARDMRLERDVAIKVLPGAFATDPDRLRRFEDEARAVAALNHSNICQIHDIGPGYLVLEFVDGEPLRGPMAVEHALRLSLQITGALEVAHRRGILHRDLKPANIMPTGATRGRSGTIGNWRMCSRSRTTAAEEVRANPRASSAKLRWAVREGRRHRRRDVGSPAE